MCALPRPLNPMTATLTVLFSLGSALALSATGSAIDDMRKCLRLTLFMVSPSLTPKLIPKFQLEESVPAHLQHDQTIAKHLGHLRRSVNAFLVVDRQIQNLQVQLCGTKQQFVVSPTVFSSPAPEHWLNSLPVAFPQHLRTAQRVLYTLPEQVGKSQAEKFVPRHVCFVHCGFRY